MTEVVFESVPVQALIDTGSPATIASLDFVMKTLATQRLPDQSPTEWADDVKKRLQQPTLTLQSYAEGELNVVCQLLAKVSRASYHIEAVVQV